MKKFFALMKVSLQSMLRSSSGRGKKSRRRSLSGMGVLALMAFLALYISGVYSAMLLGVLAPMGMEEMVFIYMGIAALVGGLLYTTFAVKGVVFGGKDNDLMLSLPVSSTMLMASRVAAIYLENLVFSFFVLVPAGVCCAVMTQSGVGHTLLFWVRVLLAALLLPLLDTALSVLLGALVAFVSSRVTKKALGQNLFMALYMVLVFWFAFSLNGMIADLAANAQAVKESLSWALPLVWMADGLLGDWVKLGGFALCCVIPFVVVIAVLGRVYRRAATGFQGQSARSDYKLSAQSAAGQKKALLTKEAKRFFGTPMYFWNAGLGLIMLLVVGVAVLWKGEMLRTVTQMLPALPLAGGVMGFCLCTCAITAPSISLEGCNLWILREAPVGEGRLIWVKTGFQLLLTLPCTFISAVLVAIGLAMPLWQGVILFIAMALFAVSHACFGMLMGLTFPKLDAVNETMVVKQSLAVMLTMFVPMGALVVAGLLNMLHVAAALVFLGGLAAVCVLVLDKKGPSMLRKL